MRPRRTWRAVQQAEHVQLDHAQPLLQGCVGCRAEQHQAGVVNQSVESAQLSDRALDRGGRIRLARDIGLEHKSRAALGADPVTSAAVPSRTRAISPC